MGIKDLLPNLKSITKSKHISEYKGKKVAVDTYSWLHKSVFCCATDLALGNKTDKWMNYIFSRIDMILSYQVKIVLVFDGMKLPSKNNTENDREERREANRQKGLELLANGDKSKANEKFAASIDITPQMAYELKQAIENQPRYQGIEFVVAPYEADSQLSYLSKTEYVHSLITEDSDMIAFGSLRVFTKMNQNGQGEEICFENLIDCTDQNFSKWTPNMFLTLCILSGCDYLSSIKGIGFKKAYELVNQNQNYKSVIHQLRNKGKHIIPQNYEEDFIKAFATFRFQIVYDMEEKKAVHLNPILLENWQSRYIDNVESMSEEEETAWKTYEQSVVDKQLILKFLDNNFNFDFLGNIDDEIHNQVSQFQIDPDTLKPYIKNNKQIVNQQNNYNTNLNFKRVQNTTNNIIQNAKIIQGTKIVPQKKFITKNKQVINKNQQGTLFNFNFTQNVQSQQSQNITQNNNNNNKKIILGQAHKYNTKNDIQEEQNQFQNTDNFSEEEDQQIQQTSENKEEIDDNEDSQSQNSSSGLDLNFLNQLDQYKNKNVPQPGIVLQKNQNQNQNNFNINKNKPNFALKNIKPLKNNQPINQIKKSDSYNDLFKEDSEDDQKSININVINNNQNQNNNLQNENSNQIINNQKENNKNIQNKIINSNTNNQNQNQNPLQDQKTLDLLNNFVYQKQKQNNNRMIRSGAINKKPILKPKNQMFQSSNLQNQQRVNNLQNNIFIQNKINNNNNQNNLNKSFESINQNFKNQNQNTNNSQNNSQLSIHDQLKNSTTDNNTLNFKTSKAVVKQFKPPSQKSTPVVIQENFTMSQKIEYTINSELNNNFQSQKTEKTEKSFFNKYKTQQVNLKTDKQNENDDSEDSLNAQQETTNISLKGSAVKEDSLLKQKNDLQNNKKNTEIQQNQQNNQSEIKTNQKSTLSDSYYLQENSEIKYSQDENQDQDQDLFQNFKQFQENSRNNNNQIENQYKITINNQEENQKQKQNSQNQKQNNSQLLQVIENNEHSHNSNSIFSQTSQASMKKVTNIIEQSAKAKKNQNPINFANFKSQNIQNNKYNFQDSILTEKNSQDLEEQNENLNLNINQNQKYNFQDSVISENQDEEYEQNFEQQQQKKKIQRLSDIEEKENDQDQDINLISEINEKSSKISLQTPTQKMPQNTYNIKDSQTTQQSQQNSQNFNMQFNFGDQNYINAVKQVFQQKKIKYNNKKYLINQNKQQKQEGFYEKQFYKKYSDIIENSQIKERPFKVNE